MSYLPLKKHELPTHLTKVQAERGMSNTVKAQEGRYWRWWYTGIIDWMLANPGKPLTECAVALHKTPATIYAVTGTDMFKEQLRARRDEFNSRHDEGIMSKTRDIATTALDGIVEHLQKKRDKVPLKDLNEMANSALARLGYGVDGPQIVQNFNNSGPQQVNIGLTPSALEEARAVMRAVEKKNSVDQSVVQPDTSLVELDNEEAGRLLENLEDAGAPLLSTDQ